MTDDTIEPRPAVSLNPASNNPNAPRSPRISGDTRGPSAPERSILTTTPTATPSPLDPTCRAIAAFLVNAALRETNGTTFRARRQPDGRWRVVAMLGPDVLAEALAG